MSGLIFNGNGDVIKAVDGSLTIEGLDFGGGNIEAGIGTFTTLNVTGVLTYEDVKNVDSVGIITSRDNINIITNNKKLNLGASGQLNLTFNGTNSVIQGTAGDTIFAADSLKLTNANASHNYFLATNGGAATLYHANNAKLATTSSGISVTGSVIASSNVQIGDSDEFIAGDGNDLRLWHNATDSYIKNYTGDLWIQADGDDLLMRASDDITLYTQTSDQAIVCIGDGQVELYHNNQKKLETTSTGIKVSGTRLEQYTSGEAQLLIGSSNAGGASIYFDGDSNGDWVGSDYSSIRHTTGGHMEYDADNPSGATHHIFKTGGTERLRILSGGQVNIGGNYTQTAYMAQVAGDLLLQKAQAAYQHPQLEIYNSNNSGHGGAIKFTGVMSGSKYQQAVIKVYGGSNSTDGSLAFCTGNGGDKVRITSAGYVGINEAAPASMLHITANNDRSSIRLTNTYDTPDNVWELNPGISGVSNTGFCIRDITDSANRFVITGTGNIGFGVNDPAVAGGYHGMEIGGTANTGIRLSATASGSWAFIDYEINGAQKFIVGCKGGDNSWRIATGASLDANVKLIVDSYGRLGIGAIPEAFHSNSKGVIRGDSGYAILGRSDNQLNISQNFYYDSSDAGKYIATGEASLYSQTDGVHKFFTAASGSANASASMQEKLQIQTDGNINFKSTNEPTIRIDSGNSSNSSCLKIEIDGTEEFRIEPGIIDYKNSSNNSRSRLLAANNYYSNTNMFIDLPQWKLSESWHILEVFGTVNPNSSGSGAYVDPCHFYIYRGQGWDGAIKHWLYCASVAPPARHAFPSGTGYAGNAGISAVWYNGSSIVGNMSATSTHYVRLLVPNANNGANFQKNFRVMRRF